MSLSEQERKLAARRLRALDAQPKVQQEVAARLRALRAKKYPQKYPPALERWIGLDELQAPPLTNQN